MSNFLELFIAVQDLELELFEHTCQIVDFDLLQLDLQLVLLLSVEVALLLQREGDILAALMIG
jgi:hypothetical protein